jgi:hypothetical protein
MGCLVTVKLWASRKVMSRSPTAASFPVTDGTSQSARWRESTGEFSITLYRSSFEYVITSWTRSLAASAAAKMLWVSGGNAKLRAQDANATNPIAHLILGLSGTFAPENSSSKLQFYRALPPSASVNIGDVLVPERCQAVITAFMVSTQPRSSRDAPSHLGAHCQDFSVGQDLSALDHHPSKPH